METGGTAAPVAPVAPVAPAVTGPGDPMSEPTAASVAEASKAADSIPASEDMDTASSQLGFISRNGAIVDIEDTE